MRFLRHRVRTFAAIAPAIVLGACASGPVEFLRRPTHPVQWPPAEAEARVRVEFAYAGAQDVETHPGFFRRLVDAIVGGEQTEFVSPCGIPRRRRLRHRDAYR